MSQGPKRRPGSMLVLLLVREGLQLCGLHLKVAVLSLQLRALRLRLAVLSLQRLVLAYRLRSAARRLGRAPAHHQEAA